MAKTERSKIEALCGVQDEGVCQAVGAYVCRFIPITEHGPFPVAADQLVMQENIDPPSMLSGCDSRPLIPHTCFQYRLSDTLV